MKKYTIIMTQSEDFIVEVEAESVAEAKFSEGDYRETGNLICSITDISLNI